MTDVLNDPPLLRVIGDVHGWYPRYKSACEGSPHTICVGDVGLDYAGIRDLDPKVHRIVGGNHDNYDRLSPHFLGDFGTYEVPNFGSIFFARGGYSIDWSRRLEGLSWWRNEELSYAEGKKAIEAYIEAKPVFVISHECPNQIKERIPFRRLTGYGEVPDSRTSKMLDAMFDAHKPKRWIFGHYHCSYSEIIDNTFFTCLKELETLDFWKYPE